VHIVVAGAGAVGARAARQLLGLDGLSVLTVADRDERRAREVSGSLGSPARGAAWSEAVVEGADAVLVALPAGPEHVAVADRALRSGAHVVSVSDAVDDVRALLALDARARSTGRFLAVGAGFSPGFTCLLARHAAAEFSSVDEIHVSKSGTAGPACARQHHAALAGESVDWRDGEWVSRQAGSGRELSWFPDPIGGRDCYRAAVPDALLLLPAFSGAGVSRITARMSATRRDRVTARIPMLRKPHAEGTIGAVRVEVRGRRGPVTDVRVLGAIDRPGVAAGAVAAVATGWALGGRLAGGGGAAGLAALVPEPAAFLHELAGRGIRAAVFEGASHG
jgi:saccharopine dehydrogenase-like NADP-dependent oxidoreductase